MPAILRTTDQHPGTSGVAFNFEDMAAQAQGYLERVRGEAAKIVAEARGQAGAIRQQAQQEGRHAAMLAAEETIHKQLTGTLAALGRAVEDLRQAKQAWLAHWEAAGVHVAAAIARRLIRRELSRQPDIPLTLVREALELAAGDPQVRIRLHPADHQALGGQVRTLVAGMSGLGEAEIVADPAVTAGGCRVETRFGVIDQQFEAQLARVEEELTQ
ncbi:MAG: FliH/SctL family protein [Thermoguttaceae bacterium]|jgi:flagellar biosynthesis/type III secretory pathway protein FliH